MPRTPYAMKTLIAQVKQHREDAEVEVEEPDGLGVYRRVTFDVQTSNWLEPLISVFGPKDHRIANFFTSRGGMLIIDFVITTTADDSTPFPIPEVDKVLNEPDPKGIDGPGFKLTGTANGEAPAKKAPAKKTAKKAAKKTIGPTHTNT